MREPASIQPGVGTEDARYNRIFLKIVELREELSQLPNQRMFDYLLEMMIVELGENRSPKPN